MILKTSAVISLRRAAANGGDTRVRLSFASALGIAGHVAAERQTLAQVLTREPANFDARLQSTLWQLVTMSLPFQHSEELLCVTVINDNGNFNRNLHS
mmetsp:Transcript_13639/g.20344  ORF Transcript_13639/g.20344 Transcript_13639/m.20344 type:complete len:98 (-) Transcript_13639:1089-1382(-)